VEEPVKRRDIPEAVLDKLAKFEQQAEYLARKVTQTQEAIAAARERLTGGFAKDSEYHDMWATLQQLVKDLPVMERNLSTAKYKLSSCKSWLDGLPDDVVLEPVKVNASRRDLAEVRQRIKDAEDELKALRAVPVPCADIKVRIEHYVSSLARPTVSGIAKGETLRVSWPNDATSVLALLLGDRMVEVLSQEVERMANDPMPLAERSKRIGELTAEVDTLQRQALALSAETCGLPPQAVLGVRAVETKTSRAA
jgi:septal ring factor EnvC (AmiA/AmiB activator)